MTHRQTGAPWGRLAVLATLLLAAAAPAAAAVPAGDDAPTTPIYALEVEPMALDEAASPTLAPYRGKVMLIVNVASRCGFTRQYAGLEALHKKYADAGLVVLGFPCNQFGGQEPGTEQEIVEFCQARFGVTFPLYAKLEVKGEGQAPLYRWLIARAEDDPGEVQWNFEKFLVGRDGQLIARYRSRTEPDDKALIEAIEKALAEPAPKPAA